MKLRLLHYVRNDEPKVRLISKSVIRYKFAIKFKQLIKTVKAVRGVEQPSVFS